ncbi:hypothetical protein [Vibrio sp. SCSIO 43136]|uniref:hypothetical protein n=1 Tax=Vibrio sp. SCSIO 43136 TaxID=2819101 RepID=UPI002074CA21|nr:hypothetical protein [Vibrio sp. SCSIO 43136]USD66456.1 hypothetical protein J4N39_06510 [Vibrio sp. SCSIO 43136]
MYKIIVKVSELLQILNTLPSDKDLDVVTGEEWLPERLIASRYDDDFLFLNFDHQPEDLGGDTEGRGFVEHEMALLRHRIRQLLVEDSDISSKTEALLAMLLISHEKSSSEVIELLEEAESASEDPQAL